MLDFILHTTTFPLLTAFLLGLVTMLSPCPFCSDLSAITFLSKEVSCMRCMVRDGVLYVLGKCFTYTLLGLVFIVGGQISGVRHFLETYGEPALGPLLIIVGLLMLILTLRDRRHGTSHPHAHHHLQTHSSCPTGKETGVKRLRRWIQSGSLSAFFLGASFALAFCPYSGLLFFGTLIPLTLAQPVVWSWTLPVLFGLGDALPVFLIAWLLSTGAAGIGKLGGNMQKVERVLRGFCIAVFIGFGLYISISHFSGHHHHEDLSTVSALIP